MSGYDPRDWKDAPDASTPITAAALEDLEERLAAYAETDPSLPLLVEPTHLRRWSAALSEAMFTPATINAVGDAVTVGVGADGNAAVTLPGNDALYRTSGMAGQLRSLFAQQYGATGDGVWNTADSRLNMQFGAVADPSTGPNHGGVKLTGAGQSVTYSLPACTDLEIWSWDGGTGTATFTIDSGGSQNLAAGAGGTPTTWSRTSVTGLANTVHTLVISSSAGVTAYIAGVHPVAQGLGVRVNRMARAGDTTANLVGQDSALNADSAAQTRQQHAYARVGAPHLVLVGLGIGDYMGQNTTSSALAQPGTTPTQYQANLQSFCTIATTAGACVLLWSGPPTPSAPSPETYTRADYANAAKTVAHATDHVAFIDAADVLKDWGTANTLGLQTSSSVNPTRKGHGLIAGLLHRVLTRPVPFG